MPAKMSVATIDKPEFINIKPCNPLISECEIKVFYLGENRNKSYITKEVAIEMANTLPGNPIVGYFREDVGDFRDHGDMVTIDDQGVHFKCMTRPYGFVAPDAKVWFQKFEETDEFGNTEIREYMMTTGYLWTGQYPECKAVVAEGRPHSMEFDEETLDGKWARNNKTGMDFFIINDAIFSKLCILGQDVEPCFEGSTVSAPNISTSFSKDVDDDFTQTLFNMMQELKFALKGEQDMIEVINNENTEIQSSFAESDTDTTSPADAEFAKKEEEKKEEETPAAEEDKEEEEEKKFAKKEDEEEEKKEEVPPQEEEEEEDKKKFAKSEDEEEEKNEDKANEPSNKEKEEEEKDKYSVLEAEHETLKAEFSALEEKYNELLAFKNQVEDEKKTELINSFYMLSDEDKAEVIENKAQYSLDDIEAKLSVICVRKKVSFNLDSEEDVVPVESPVTTFSLETDTTSTPAWVSAVRNTKNSRNI